MKWPPLPLGKPRLSSVSGPKRARRTSLDLWRTLSGLEGPLLAALVHVHRRRRRHARAARALAEKEGREHVPLTLHPVINPDICIGSLTCLKACPEGDILGVVNGTAQLIQADHCIGHGKCAAECPV